MRWLIDGYNLLYAAGIPGRGFGVGSLERSRLGLLHFLADSLEPEEAACTTVVFDAQGAPPGLPRSLVYRGLSVRFAPRQATADDLLEELIRADTAPRQLTVVSSDHRVQRAARRRKARAVDSGAWYSEICARRAQRRRTPGAVPLKPAPPLVEAEVAHWLEQFGGQGIVEALAESEGTSPRPAGEPPAEKPTTMENPFPPGYAEDILSDE
ncbi:MAG: NYN domain-containing protein [Thermoguttaceae bacterium]|jgi:predicted RNA-binding protein with PIN domain|nr:NYN domain-containing protein [Thermoguttaceae bacterium]